MTWGRFDLSFANVNSSNLIMQMVFVACLSLVVKVLKFEACP